MEKNKLRAFTVMELMVALVLTAIVVSIAFLAMRTLTAQFGELTMRNRLAGAASRMQAALRADALRAEAIRATDTGLQFDMAGSPPIRYESSDSSIARIGPLDQAEAFELLLDSISCTFQGENVAIGMLADQAVIWCRQGMQPLTFTVLKNYDAETRMRLTDKPDEQY